LGEEEIAALLEIAGGWSDDMAAYKGRDKWIGELKRYAVERGVRVDRE
jgi:hypothetical protein